MAEVWLRDWRETDVDAVASVRDDPQVNRWSSLGTLEPEQWLFEQRRGDRGPSRAICEAGEDQALGKVAIRLPGRASAATTGPAIRPEDRPAGELSYWVVAQARGRGIATAGVVEMIALASRLDAMRSLVLDIELDNLASLRLATTIGAQRREPVHRERDRSGVVRQLAVHVVAL